MGRLLTHDPGRVDLGEETALTVAADDERMGIVGAFWHGESTRAGRSPTAPAPRTRAQEAGARVLGSAGLGPKWLGRFGPFTGVALAHPAAGEGRDFLEPR